MANITDNITTEGLVDTLAIRTQATVQATASGTLALTTSSPWLTVFTGTVAGQIIRMPDATSLPVGYQQSVHNNSTQSVVVANADETTLITLTTTQRVTCFLQVSGTTAGTWSILFGDDAVAGIQYYSLMQGLDDLQYVDGNLDIGHSPLGFLRGASGTNAAVSMPTTPVDSSVWGFMQFTTGTTTTGRCWVSAVSSTFQLNAYKLNMEFRVMIPILSVSGQRFTYSFGFMNGTAAGQPTSGLYFSHTDTVNSGNWTLNAVKTSSLSTLDTTVLPVAGTWYRLRFEYISSSLVNCYVNDALVGTIISNIPNLTNIYCVFKQEKPAAGGQGSTARLAYMDSIWWRLDR